MGGAKSVTHINKFYMETKTVSKADLLRELEQKVHDWVNNRFNFIQLEVVEKMADDMLVDYIVQPDFQDSIIEYLDDCDEIVIIEDYCKSTGVDNVKERIDKYVAYKGNIEDSFVACIDEDWDGFLLFTENEYADDIQEYIDEQENYPLWNTLFEWRDSYYNGSDTTDVILSKGCGVIEELDGFNNLVFMKSAGHSFYSAYWIPIYLELYPDEQEKYSDINYKGL
jgi:hypothetical protein